MIITSETRKKKNEDSNQNQVKNHLLGHKSIAGFTEDENPQHFFKNQAEKGFIKAKTDAGFFKDPASSGFFQPATAPGFFQAKSNPGFFGVKPAHHSQSNPDNANKEVEPDQEQNKEETNSLNNERVGAGASEENNANHQNIDSNTREQDSKTSSVSSKEQVKQKVPSTSFPNYTPPKQLNTTIPLATLNSFNTKEKTSKEEQEKKALPNVLNHPKSQDIIQYPPPSKAQGKQTKQGQEKQQKIEQNSPKPKAKYKSKKGVPTKANRPKIPTISGLNVNANEEKGLSLSEWKQGVKKQGNSLPTPKTEAGDQAISGLQEKGKDLQNKRTEAPSDHVKAIEKTLPKAPEATDEPVAALSPIEKEIQALLAPHKNKLLPEQQMLPLQPTPSGIMPKLGDTPQAVAIEQHLKKELAAQADANLKNTKSKNQKQVEQVRQVTAKMLPKDAQKGNGEGLKIQDHGEPARPQLPEALQADIGEVLAQLLADPSGEAKDMLDEVRKRAYPNEALHLQYPDIGDSEIPKLSSLLSSELKAIAEDAGITATDLQAKVAEQQQKIKEQQTNATDQLKAQNNKDKDALQKLEQKEEGAIEGAKNAADLKMEKQMEVANGSNDPEVVKMKAERLRRQLSEQLGKQRAYYDRSKTRRSDQLKQAKQAYIQAYEAAALREQIQLKEKQAAAQKDQKDQNKEANKKSNQLEKANIRLWKDARLEEVKTNFAQLSKSADETIDTYKKDLETAITTATEKVETWEAEQTGKQKSWWQKLLAAFKDWFTTAKAEAEVWKQVNIQKNRDALVQDLQVLQQLQQKGNQQIDLAAIEQQKGLSEEQKAILKTYYGQGPNAGNSILAVAEGLRVRLRNQHQGDISKKFLSLLEKKPAGEWREITNIAQSQNGGFNARKICTDVYDAMKGGLGIGTEEDAVYNALGGLSKLELIAVKKCYLESYEASLEDHLKGEFSGSEEDRALALLEGKSIEADAAALYYAMDGGLTGIGTDEDTIMKVLRNKTPEERQKLIDFYKEKYGQDLTAALDDELSSNELNQATALMDGDTAKADAIALQIAMNGNENWFGSGMGTNEEGMEQTYEQIRKDVEAQAAKAGWTTEQVEAEIARRNQDVEQAYNNEFGDRYDLKEGESALRKEFKDELSNADLDLVDALADNDLAKADAARIGIETDSFFWASDDKINEVLESQYKRAVKEMKRDEWPKIEQKLAAEAQKNGWDPYKLQEEKRKAEAQLEQDAIKKSKGYMNELDSAYAEGGYGTGIGLNVDLIYNTSGHEEDKAMDLFLQGGYLDPTQQIEYATKGLGTKEAEFKQVFEGKTQEEVEKIKTDYEAKHGEGSLERLIESELNQQDAFDTKMVAGGMINGKHHKGGLAKNVDEDYANAKLRYEWEKSNTTGRKIFSHTLAAVSSPVGALLGDTVYDNYFGGQQEKILDKDMAFLEKQYKVLKDDRLTDEQRALAQSLFTQGTSNVDASIQGLRKQADAVTNSVATAAALTVATAVGAVLTAATGGAAGPGVAAAIGSLSGALGVSTTAVVAGTSALAATAASVGVKKVLLGSAYGNDDMMIDMGVGAVDIAAAMATVGVGKAVNAAILSKITKEGVDIAQNPAVIQRLFAEYAAEGAESIVSGIPSALTGNLLNDQNWNGNVVLNILKGVTQEVGEGLMIDGAMSTGGRLKGLIPSGDPNSKRTNTNKDGANPQTYNIDDRPQVIDTDTPATHQDNGSGFDIDLGDDLPIANPQKGDFEVDTTPDAKKPVDQTVNTTPSPDTPPAKAIETVKPATQEAASDAKKQSTRLLEPAPSDLQSAAPSGTKVYVDPNLDSNTVRVQYELDDNGLVTNVFIRAGKQATATDIQLHGGTVRTMRRYSGLSGRVRKLVNQVRQWIGLNGNPPIGSAAWEASLEIEKLPAIIQKRMKSLQNPDLTDNMRAALEADIDNLEAQLTRHQAVLDKMITSEGRGYVAAEGVDELTKKWQKASGDDAQKMDIAIKEQNMPDPKDYESGLGITADDYTYKHFKDEIPPFKLVKKDGAVGPVVKIIPDGSGGWKLEISKVESSRLKNAQKFKDQAAEALAEGNTKRAEALTQLADWLKGSTDSTKYRNKLFTAIETQFADGKADSFIDFYKGDADTHAALSKLKADLDAAKASGTEFDINKALKDIFKGSDFNAHHVLSVNLIYNNEILQEILIWAVENGKKFDFNSIDNLIFVSVLNHTKGNSRGHNLYDLFYLSDKINTLESVFDLDPEAAYSNLANEIENIKKDIKTHIVGKELTLDDLKDIR